MPTYRLLPKGRRAGAIGIFYVLESIEIVAPDEATARVKAIEALSDEYEFYCFLSVWVVSDD